MSARQPGQEGKTVYPSKALRRVHITLIFSGIAFTFGFAALKLWREADLSWAVASFLAGVGLSLYLRSFMKRTG
jgi:hypothetical protein